MSKYEQMIILVPPFSLDKQWDNADFMRPSGLFGELINYIPDKGILITREGITPLTYTPQTT